MWAEICSDCCLYCAHNLITLERTHRADRVSAWQPADTVPDVDYVDLWFGARESELAKCILVAPVWGRQIRSDCGARAEKLDLIKQHSRIMFG